VRIEVKPLWLCGFKMKGITMISSVLLN